MTQYEPPHNPSGYDARDQIELSFRRSAQIVRMANDQTLTDEQRRARVEAIMSMSDIHPQLTEVIIATAMQAVLIADRLRRYEPVVLFDNLRIGAVEAEE